MPLRCALCGGSPEGGLKKCTRCGTTHYCNRECQKKDWRVHRRTCSSDEDHFEVTARLLSGEHRALGGVTRLTSVAQVKAMLLDWTRDDAELELIHRGALLADAQTLGEAGVSAGEEIQVIKHLPTPLANSSSSGDEPPLLANSSSSGSEQLRLHAAEIGVSSSDDEPLGQ